MSSSPHPEFQALAQNFVSYRRMRDQAPDFVEKWLKASIKQERLRSKNPVGEYGDFAFAPQVCRQESNFIARAFKPLTRRNPKFLPIQTKSFFGHLPREIRDMVYTNILAPFRSIQDTMILNLHGHHSQKWHPSRDLYDIFIDSWPPEYMNSILAQSFESLRTMSNTHPLIRHELGQMFWKKASLNAHYTAGQQRLTSFFTSRPAIKHLTSLDLGKWNPSWCSTSDWYNEKEKNGRMFRELARIGVTFDYLKMDLLSFQHGTVMYPTAPVELYQADIIDVLSYDAKSPPTFDNFSNNFSNNLKASSYDWINAFRKLSVNIKKALNLTVHQKSENRSMVAKDFVFRDEKCPLLQWHLCPRKRPTFMSLLGDDLKLPEKKEKDLLYCFVQLGLDGRGRASSVESVPPQPRRESIFNGGEGGDSWDVGAKKRKWCVVFEGGEDRLKESSDDEDEDKENEDQGPNGQKRRKRV